MRAIVTKMLFGMALSTLILGRAIAQERALSVEWLADRDRVSLPVLSASWEWVESDEHGDSFLARPVIRFFVELPLAGLSVEQIEKITTSSPYLQIAQTQVRESGAVVAGFDLSASEVKASLFNSDRQIGELDVRVTEKSQKIMVWRECPDYEIGFRRSAKKNSYLYLGLNCEEDADGITLTLIPSHERGMRGSSVKKIKLAHADRRIVQVKDHFPTHDVQIGIREKLNSRFGFDIGWDTVYSHYVEGDRHDLSLVSLATRIGFSRLLSPRWLFRSFLTATIFPIVQNFESLDVHFVNGSTYAQYLYPLNKQWAVGAGGGFYYVSMFTRRASFGYRHQMGPQLLPTLRHHLNDREELSISARFAMISGRGFTIKSANNSEVGGSFGWSRTLTDRTRVGVRLAFTHLELRIKTIDIRATHTALQTVFEF